MRIGLYLHVPFCRVRCPYCSFNVYAGIEDRIPGYIDALPRELELRLESLGAAAPTRLDSVYLGGGTPSLLSEDDVGELLRRVAERIELAPDAEVTLEIDPGTADLARLRGYRSAGVDRATVGVQTFHPGLLAELGRAHDVADARATLEDLRRAGFDNVNVDLMFGLVGQTPEMFERDLTEALAHEPAHLSLYNLTVEPGTAYARRQDRGALPLPDEEAQATMYEAAVERTAAAGVPRYEVSNFARPGRRSRHNQLHWTGGTYLGVGAGAHGFDPAAERRWWNVRSPRRWERAVRDGVLPEAGFEALDRDELLAEAVLLGLRRIEGIDRRSVRRRFGSDPGLAAQGAGGADDLVAEGWMEVDEGAVRLTSAGFLVADHLAERLLRRLDPPRSAG